MFAAHGAPATSGAKPAFSAAPPTGDARLSRPVPKRRWSIDRLEALFSGRAPASAGEPKPTSVEKQSSVDPDSASLAKGRRMTRWSSAPAKSNLWRSCPTEDTLVSRRSCPTEDTLVSRRSWPTEDTLVGVAEGVKTALEGANPGDTPETTPDSVMLLQVISSRIRPAASWSQSSRLQTKDALATSMAAVANLVTRCRRGSREAAGPTTSTPSASPGRPPSPTATHSAPARMHRVPPLDLHGSETFHACL